MRLKNRQHSVVEQVGCRHRRLSVIQLAHVPVDEVWPGEKLPLSTRSSLRNGSGGYEFWTSGPLDGGVAPDWSRQTATLAPVPVNRSSVMVPAVTQPFTENWALGCKFQTPFWKLLPVTPSPAPIPVIA
jgi:hypothetical protein